MKKIFVVYINQEKKENLIFLENHISNINYLVPIKFISNAFEKPIYFLMLSFLVVVLVFLKLNFQSYALAYLAFILLYNLFSTDLKSFLLDRGGYKVKDIIYADSSYEAEYEYHKRAESNSSV